MLLKVCRKVCRNVVEDVCRNVCWKSVESLLKVCRKSVAS